ncbi:MAG: hypothetical protein ABI835_11230 [Chloroflexota bacterium]
MPSEDYSATPKPGKRLQLSCRRAGCFLLGILCLPVILFLLFLTVLSPPARAAAPPAPLRNNFMKGISYVSAEWGEQPRFSSAESDQTLSEIVVPSGANWLAVIVTCHQQNKMSTEIGCERAASDDDLRHVMQRAHDQGLSVMLKPHVDLLDMKDANTGRFNIDFGSDEASWAAWFESYSRVITHYAELAEEMGAEYFAVGTELGGTTHRADEWRALVARVRELYGGRLTYAALTYVEPVQITWWDALDSIGIDAYFGLTLTKAPTLAQMSLGWTPTIVYLNWLAAHWQMPVILTEIGYMSVDGTNILPGYWSLDGDTDLQEQADAYQSLIEAFSGQEWWQGIFWWALSTDPQQGGAEDQYYSFAGKPAEDVLWNFFHMDE